MYHILKLLKQYCNILDNASQQEIRVLQTFVPNKPFGILLETVPTNFVPLKTFNSEFQTIEVLFTDQNSQPLDIIDRINLTLVTK